MSPNDPESPTRPLDFDGPTARVVAVLDQYLDDLKRGDAPNRDALLAAHPDIAPQLEACLGGIDFIHQAESSGEAGQKLGDFRIVREIGRGGMGAVYEAEQISLGRRVALKILRFGTVADADALDRFEREASTVAQLHHTNIVPIFAVGSEAGINYYAMQLIQGRSLDQVLHAAGKRIPVKTVSDWGLQAADALAHAHERHVVHRDVKPSNLILDDDGRVWLTDFGLAKRMDDVTLSMTGALLGTPRYMSPEQAAATTQKLDHRTDIYSLGATLYELTTGQPVFVAETPHGVILQILTDEPLSPRHHCTDIPRDLETILLKCLSKEPQQRYASAGDLANDLRAFLEGRSIAARRQTAWERTVRWARRQQRSFALTGAAAATTLILLLAVIFGWVRYQSWNLSFVSFATDAGTLVAEVVNQRDESMSGEFTVPTQQPLSITRGEYTVHVRADEKLSQAYEMALDRGQQNDFKVMPADNELGQFKLERTAALIRDDDRARLLVLDDDGIQLMEMGSPLWDVNLAASTDPVLRDAVGLVWPWDASILDRRFGGYDKFDLRPFVARWPAAASTSADSWSAIPIGDAADLDADGAGDVVIAARHQGWLMAVSGASGSPLWCVRRGAEFTATVPEDFRQSRQNYGVRSAVLYAPQWVADMDQDGCPDLLAILGDVGIGELPDVATRWVEAFSGATGKTLWRFDLPNDLLTSADGTETAYAWRWFVAGVQGHTSAGGHGSSTSSRGRRRRWSMENSARRGDYVAIPSDLRISAHGTSGETFVSLIAGDHLIQLGIETGKATAPPQRLGISAGRPPAFGDVDGDGVEDFVLVQRLPDLPNPGTRALNDRVPRARVVAYSPAQQRQLWSREVTARWPERVRWFAGLPDWPIVVDMDDDGVCEVIVPDGSSIEPQARTYRQATPWGRLVVLDGARGEVRWQRQIATMDQYLEHFTVGPDINDDGIQEIYVAALWGADAEMFIDCLSGATGHSLWCTRRAIHAQRYDRYYLGSLAWWDLGNDGWPQLVATAYDAQSQSGNDQVRVVISAGSGQMTQYGTGLPFATVADLDADGCEDVCLLRVDVGPRMESLDAAGTLQIVRGSRESWRKLTAKLEPAGDFDGDGVRDLVRTHTDRLAAYAGKTGRRIWMADLSGGHWSRRAVASRPGWDLNADGVDDLLVYVDQLYSASAGYEQAPVEARDGRTGQTLWEADLRTEIIAGTSALDCRDLDDDGEVEVIVVAGTNLDYANLNHTGQATQLSVSVLAGRNGLVRWRQPLTRDYGNKNQFQSPYDPTQMQFSVAYADLNGDGVDDILLPAEDDTQRGVELLGYGGHDGQLIWRHGLPATTFRPRDLLDNVPPPSVGDLDGDGRLEIVVLAFEDTTNGRLAHVRVLNAADGSPRWEWQTAVHGECGNVYYSDQRQVRPRPLLLANGHQQRVCVNLHHDSARLVVLDHAGRLVSDWTSTKDEVPSRFRVWACDPTGDGHDQLVLVRRGQLELVPPDQLGTAIWTLNDEFDEPQVLEVLPASDAMTARIVAQSYYLDNRVLSIDASSGRPLTACAGPTPHGPGIAKSTRARLLSNVQQTRAENLAVCFQYDQTSVVRRSAGAPLAKLPRTDISRSAHDPRLFRPLPWSPPRRGNALMESFQIMGWAAVFGIMMVMLPCGVIWQLVRQRTSSLRKWLLLPVAAAGFLAAALIPGGETSGNGMLHRFGMGAAAMPAWLLVIAGVRWIIQGQWPQLLRWLSISIVVTLAIAAIGLGVLHPRDVGPLLPGERYSLRGWYFVWLIGAYFTGGLLMLTLALSAAWKRLRVGRVQPIEKSTPTSATV